MFINNYLLTTIFLATQLQIFLTARQPESKN